MTVIKLLFTTKKHVLAIIAIVLLLIVQAFCDLSLPRYTSDIVDVGIMQGGIENAVPNEIRTSSLETLELFMPEKDIEKVEKSYKEGKGGIMKLTLDREDDAAEVNKLNKAFEIPMLISMAGQGDAEKIDIPQLMQGYKAGLVTKEALLDMRSKAEEEIGDLGELMAETAAVSYVKSEYEAMDLDMQGIQTDYMKHIGLIMIFFTIISIISAITVGFIASYTASEISMKLRENIFHKVLGFSNVEMDKFTAASLITRSTNDIQQIQLALVMFLRLVLLAPIMGIGGVIMVFGTKTGMGWIVGVAVAFLLVVVVGLLRLTLPKFRILQVLVDKINLVSREILTGLPVIRAFSREAYERERFDRANTDLFKTQLFTNRAMTMMFPFMMLVMNVISVVIVWFGGKNIDLGHLQVGDMMAFITYTIQIVMSFMMLSMISVILPRANVAAERVVDVIKTESSIVDRPDIAPTVKNDWKGLVSFENVNFRFPDADEDLLTNINFTAEPGKTTAIIGSTGSGKSTLVNLIPRLFDVTSGRITIDGVDIRDMKLHDLRSLLGVVPQKGMLFSGTISSNIGFGVENLSDEAMRRAAQIAQAEEFVLGKEDTYESDISQGATNVSGGQKQRIAIARAVSKDPKVFIFDDSFSALDYRTEVQLRRALAENLGDTTVIVIAQRISTILHADKILVLDEGAIVGCGTHKELMSSSEVYREIAQSQLNEQELSA